MRRILISEKTVYVTTAWVMEMLTSSWNFYRKLSLNVKNQPINKGQITFHEFELLEGIERVSILLS